MKATTTRDETAATLPTSPLASRTVMPPTDRLELHEIDQILAAHPRLVDGDGHAIPLPKEVFDVLCSVVAAMRAGRAITITPTTTRLTTGEAATFLGVSRPTLVKLLEEGRIPYEKPNRHRYVQLADLEAYRQERAVQRREVLDDFSRSAADFGPDGITLEEATAAVEKVRKTRSH